MKKVIIPKANFCFCAPVTKLKLGVQVGIFRVVKVSKIYWKIQG